MKKFSLLLLMAALALPMMAQYASKEEAMGIKHERKATKQGTPLKAFDWKLVPADMLRATETIVWDFEDEDALEGWMTIDADGDGYGWEIVSDGHGDSDHCIYSYSYLWDGISQVYTELNPDNWLISPEVKLGGTLTFYSIIADDWYPDKFAVYVCVGEPTSIYDFVKVSDDIVPPYWWKQYTIDLSDFEGEKGCFAFRHYDSYNQYGLVIDDISYTYNPVLTPKGLWVEPDTRTADASWDQGEDSKWNLRYRPYQPTGPDAYTLWDFEDYVDDLDGWTTIDNEHELGWFLWDPLSLEYDPDDGGRLLGTQCATSASYHPELGDFDPDNWLISPRANLHNRVSLWAAAQDPSFPDDVFAVYVSTGDDPTDLDSFVKVSDDITVSYPIQQYTFDLTEFGDYEGLQGYVAVRHYKGTYNGFRVNIDNVMVGEIPDEGEWIYVYDIEDPFFTIPGLTPVTTYEAQVQAIATDDNLSNWTKSFIFTTLAESHTVIDELVKDKTVAGVRYYNMLGQEMREANGMTIVVTTYTDGTSTAVKVMK